MDRALAGKCVGEQIGCGVRQRVREQGFGGEQRVRGQVLHGVLHSVLALHDALVRAHDALALGHELVVAQHDVLGFFLQRIPGVLGCDVMMDGHRLRVQRLLVQLHCGLNNGLRVRVLLSRRK